MAERRASALAAYPAATFLSRLEQLYPCGRSGVDDVIGYEALYHSALKCCRGVGWKHSTKAFMLHAAENIVALGDSLADGTYKEGRTHIVRITYPKPRTAIAISFADRVFQRSMNDNRLYPAMTRSFIYANFACQKGKGTDAAREFAKKALRRAFLNYGTNRFKVVCGDFRNYYGTMRHDITNAMFRRRLDPWSAYWAIRTLDRQYKGDTGYNPGSQMVQIAGISYLDPFDHYMKEGRRQKYYWRYMDDWHVCVKDENEARDVIAEAGVEAAKVGLELHPKKTHFVDASEGFVFLGFLFRVTATGRVLMLRDPKRIKEIRRRMVRLAHKVRRGETRGDALDVSYRCVRACMEKGNGARLLSRMDLFYNQLKGENEHGKVA